MRMTARVFQNGRSQAVRLPRELRFDGDTVRARRFGRGVLLEPIFSDASEWFEALDQIDEALMPDGREQPLVPKREIFG